VKFDSIGGTVTELVAVVESVADVDVVLVEVVSVEVVSVEVESVEVESVEVESVEVESVEVESVEVESVEVESVEVESVEVESVAVESVAVESVAVESVAVESVAVESVAVESVDVVSVVDVVVEDTVGPPRGRGMSNAVVVCVSSTRPASWRASSNSIWTVYFLPSWRPSMLYRPLASVSSRPASFRPRAGKADTVAPGTGTPEEVTVPVNVAAPPPRDRP
jgi:hypothetical protein